MAMVWMTCYRQTVSHLLEVDPSIARHPALPTSDSARGEECVVAEQRADAALDPDDPLPALADMYGRTVEDLAFVLLRHRLDDRSNCVACSFHRMCPWDGCVHAFAARVAPRRLGPGDRAALKTLLFPLHPSDVEQLAENPDQVRGTVVLR
jgi:hypothetical protein